MLTKYCLNCKFAKWQRGPTGRILKTEPGKCTYEVPEIKLPRSLDGVKWQQLKYPLIYKQVTKSQWYNDCPCWEGVEK